MFKDRIKDLRTKSNYSQAQLAQKLNVSKSLIAHWESGKATPPSETIMGIADIFNVTTDWLLGISNYEYPNVMTHSVPVYGTIPAGIPFEAIEDRLDDIPIPDWLAKKRDLFGLVIKGDSMDRILPDGVVGVFQKTETLDNGEIGAILVNGYDATVKRFYRLTDAVLLEPQSHNPDYKPTIIKDGDTPVTIIGRLLWYSPVGLVK